MAAMVGAAASSHFNVTGAGALAARVRCARAREDNTSATTRRGRGRRGMGKKGWLQDT